MLLVLLSALYLLSYTGNKRELLSYDVDKTLNTKNFVACAWRLAAADNIVEYLIYWHHHLQSGIAQNETWVWREMEILCLVLKPLRL